MVILVVATLPVTIFKPSIVHVKKPQRWKQEEGAIFGTMYVSLTPCLFATAGK
jgi:hypothetical protein